MALWTDDDFVAQADLAIIESEVPAIATNESITVDGASGMVRQALSEAGAHLLSQVQQFGQLPVSRELTSTHLAAVLNTGSGNRNAPLFTLSRVVADDKGLPGLVSPLKTWVVYWALWKFYTNAWNRNVGDSRYAQKAAEFKLQTDVMFETLRRLGVPIVYSALAAPGAIHEFQRGVFVDTAVTESGSGTWAANTYYFAVTYTGAEYVSVAAKNNHESGPSVTVSKAIAASKEVTVDITALSQAAIQPHVGLASAHVPRITPTGWNLYVGTSAASLYLQNTAPIAIATKTHAMSAATLSGTLMDSGQHPDAYINMPRMLQRG